VVLDGRLLQSRVRPIRVPFDPLQVGRNVFVERRPEKRFRSRGGCLRERQSELECSLNPACLLAELLGFLLRLAALRRADDLPLWRATLAEHTPHAAAELLFLHPDCHRLTLPSRCRMSSPRRTADNPTRTATHSAGSVCRSIRPSAGAAA